MAVPLIALGVFFYKNEQVDNFSATNVGRNRLLADTRYLGDKNRKELGAWNSQFNCFEGDAWCNKDIE